ncbi:MAG: DNA polymerase, partial [Burkholderiaceae bacterium]
MTQKTLLLVDGSSYLYRAYHAMPDLRGPGGEPTGAIRGMVAMMKLLREQIGADYAACVFDAKGKTFRDDWYPEYKANRSSMPEDLALQIEPIHAVVEMLGWPIIMVPGIEADDAIGTLARAATRAGWKTVISTGDKDMAQLVDEHVTLINTMSNETLDVAGVLAKFGVPPERIIDYLALIGDTVDNVPGVNKVGPKTAVKWLQEHGSLDGVIAAAPTMKGAVGEHLRAALDWLPMGRKLVTVVTDHDMTDHVGTWPALDALALRPVDHARLLEFYQRYGFRGWRDEIEKQLGVPAAPAVPVGANRGLFDDEVDVPAVPVQALAHEYETIFTFEQLDAWIARLQAAPLSALDTETDSLDAMRARIIGISFAVEPGKGAYVPLRHDYAGAPDQLPFDEAIARLRPWLENPAARKVGQHVKYDIHVFANIGVAVQGFEHDTLLQSYVLEAHRPHGLASLADRHLGRKGLDYEDLCGKGAKQIPFSKVDIERAAHYSGEDSEMTLQVHQALYPRIAARPGMKFVYESIEMPTSAVLGRVERHGVLIDSARLAEQSRILSERMMALENEAYEIAGQPFNLGSPKQIGEILFGKLGLPVTKKTASGAPSTDEGVLEKLALDYPLPAKLLEHRGLSKLKGTYTDKLPQMVNPDTGRVHTHYAQAVAITGRL